MKKLLIAVLLTLIGSAGFSQLVARVEMKEDVPGICDKNNVYSLMKLFGKDQEEAVPPLSVKKLEQRLNEEVTFLQQHPEFEGKGIVGVFINCKGELVQCKIDNKTGSDELDGQIVAVIATMKEWKAGKLAGRKVDSVHLYSFDVVKGKLILH